MSLSSFPHNRYCTGGPAIEGSLPREDHIEYIIGIGITHSILWKKYTVLYEAGNKNDQDRTMTCTAQTGLTLLRTLHLMHPEAKQKKKENSYYGPKFLQISPQVLIQL